MRVLIVDDSDMVRTVLAAMVKRLGHTAVPVATAAAALAADPCDAVFLDHSLPDMPGSDVARRLRERGLRAPIYGISGHDDAKTRFADAGVDGHVPKPFRLPDVAAALGVAHAHVELDDPKLVRAMLRGILDEAPRLMKQARATDAPDEMRRIAHTLRGSLRFLDAPRARDAAARLEEAAKEGTIDDEARRQLGRELDALLPHLAQLLG